MDTQVHLVVFPQLTTTPSTLEAVPTADLRLLLGWPEPDLSPVLQATLARELARRRAPA